MVCTESVARAAGLRGDVGTQYRNAARLRQQHAADQTQQRALATPARALQKQTLAAFHAQFGNVEQRRGACPTETQIAQMNRWRGGIRGRHCDAGANVIWARGVENTSCAWPLGDAMLTRTS